MNAGRRVRAYLGQFALLGALALVAALLITGIPRTANRLADQGFREQISGQRPAVRDLLYRETPDANEPVLGGATRPELLDLRQRSMAPVLRDAIGEHWYAEQTAEARAIGSTLKPGPPLNLIVRATTGGQQAVRMVAGQWPRGGDFRGQPGPVNPKAPVEIALAQPVADELGLHVGDVLTARVIEPREVRRNAPMKADGSLGLRLAVVGIFTAADPAGGIWDAGPSALRTIPPPPDAEQGPVVAVALTSGGMMATPQAAMWPITHTWRYRVTPDRVDAGQAQPLIDAIRQLDLRVEPGVHLTKGLDIPLLAFVRTVAAARAVLAVIAAAVLATLNGLIILAARLAVRRRAEEFTLLRARGGAVRRVAGRSLAEALLVVPAAVLLGWLLGAMLPGRAAGGGWLLAGAAVLITLAFPVATVAARPAVGGRRDLIRLPASARRLTVEVLVLGLAAVGVVLLRRRGLPADGGLDPLLASVPVLFAVGAAVLALRVYPAPLRMVSRMAVRARGTVPFLGLARAGRATVTGPLIVVVVGVAAAAFCAAVAAGIADGRERAAGLTVPADVLITGDFFAPDTADALAGLPGTEGVAPLVIEANQELLAPGAARSSVDPVTVLVVDGPRFAQAAAAAGAQVELPAALTGASGPTGPVPAVLSPAVAAEMAGGGVVTTAGQKVDFRVGAVTGEFPLIDRESDRFVVLPWQALRPEAQAALVPTGFLVASSRLDRAAVQRVADEGQWRFASAGQVTGGPPARPSMVITRADVHDTLASGGANGLLYFGFRAGVLGGAVLGLLAIAFAVLAGAGERGRVLSRLRTMGLSRPQWRGLMLVELAPLVGAAVLTGAVAGVVLPLLLTPALGLSTFTDGVAVRVRFDAGLAGVVVALGVLALGFAVAVEATINRRLRLGEVLRLGEES